LQDWERQAIGDAVAAGEKPAAVGAEFNISAAYAGELAVTRGGQAKRKRGRPSTKNKQVI
jgi:hypothetical protein